MVRPQQKGSVLHSLPVPLLLCQTLSGGPRLCLQPPTCANVAEMGIQLNVSRGMTCTGLQLRENLALAQEMSRYKWEQGLSPASAVPFAALTKMLQLPLLPMGMWWRSRQSGAVGTAVIPDPAQGRGESW